MRTLSLLLILVVCGCSPKPESVGLTDYVNPLIGTAQATTERILGKNTETYAQVIPVVSMPHGMTGWTPQTRTTEKKCQAPYYYSDSLITGIRGTHWLNGSCVQDYGSMTLMPLSDPGNFRAEDRGIRLDHGSERSSIAEYTLSDEEIGLDLAVSSTERCGVVRITWQKSGIRQLVMEPNSDEGAGSIRIEQRAQRIYLSNPVHRIYQGWGESAGFSGHFVLEFDQPFQLIGTYDNDSLYQQVANHDSMPGLGGIISFDSSIQRVQVRIGTSFTSAEEAVNNLREELSHQSFDQTVTELEAEWERVLQRVEVKGEEQQKESFYTGLYRCFLHPRLMSDASGTYPAFAGFGEVERTEGWNYYGDFSTWDTYRAVHPLHNLLAPEYSKDFVTSLVRKAQAGGWMPIFPCWNSYTAAMIGDHLGSVIADAYVKGIEIPLIDTAYAYLRKNAFESPQKIEEYRNGKGRRALESYLAYGYIPMEDKVPDAFHKQEQVSRTLEYAYDDFCLARIAEGLGYQEDAAELDRRAGNYHHVFDPENGFVRGRHADGSWAEEFELDGDMEYITEGTPWHYSWYVPHDVPGLMEIMGGDSAFIARLDSFFESGSYWHGNEPCHQTYFLYTYTSQPWKSQRMVRHILQEDYHSGPGGLSGNEDGGQMSAWMVFASMGLYPVCPGTTEYALVSPVFEEVRIRPSHGQEFIIRSSADTSRDEAIQGAEWNGEPLNSMFIDHTQIRDGGILEFTSTFDSE